MNDDDHPVLTAVGLAAVALGVLMVVQPSVASAVGVDYAAVIVVGLLALVQGVRVARARRASEIQGAETPDVETVETMPTPGDDFDRRIAEWRSGSRRTRIRERTDLRDVLEDAATTAVADRENCSREAAAERIESGTWTDDPHAASLLGGPGTANPPIFDRIRLAASTESAYQYKVRRTADAIARVAGVVPEDGESADAESGRSRNDATTDGTASESGGGEANPDDSEADGREVQA
jgi:hypothetical protein